MPAMRATLGALAMASLIVLPTVAGAWASSVVGDVPRPLTDLAVGDGDRDGTSEVYAAGQHVHQIRNLSGTWTSTAIWPLGAGAPYPTTVAVGDGDRDGRTEVYAGFHGQVRRYAWNGTAWNGRVLTDLGGIDTHIAGLSVGDAENDGLQELWLTAVTVPLEGAAYSKVWKVFFSAGQWQRSLAANLSAQVAAAFLGDGDRDGLVELYLGSDDRLVRQLERVNGTWQATSVGTMTGPVVGVVTGDANGDGKVDVYAASSDHRIARFALVSGSWVRVGVADFGPTRTLTGLTVADVEPGGRTELYASAADGHVYQATWDGSTWVPADLGGPGAEGDQALSVAAGEADMDGAAEVVAGLSVAGEGPSYPRGAVARWVA